MRAWLITIGRVLVVVGLLWPWLAKLGLGRLPGDIVIERGSFSFYFPIVTCLVISVVLSLARLLAAQPLIARPFRRLREPVYSGLDWYRAV